MAIGRRMADSGDEEVRIDLSPMIDCVFILLIFFIVTTVFVEETGIEVNRPDGGANLNNNNEKNEIVELEITQQGAVRYRGRDIGVDGVVGVIKQMRVNQPDIPVLIKAGQKTPHNVFAEVYGKAKLAGAEKISFK